MIGAIDLVCVGTSQTLVSYTLTDLATGLAQPLLDREFASSVLDRSLNDSATAFGDMKVVN